MCGFTRTTQALFGVAFALAFVAVQPVTAETMQVTQTFDTLASTTAAGWTAFQTTINGANYGWSNTSTVTGTGGEAGGIFVRTGSTAPSYFADTTIGQSGTTYGTINRALETLTWSGKFNLSNVNFDGGFLIGYATSGTTGIMRSTQTGLLIQNPATAGDPFRAGFTVGTGTSANSASPTFNLTQGVTYSFSMTWTPALTGGGTMSGSISGTAVPSWSTTSTVPVLFDVFGIVAPGGGSPNSTLKTGSSYFDDLTYAVVPEPSTIMMVLGAVGSSTLWLARRTRRRFALPHPDTDD